MITKRKDDEYFIDESKHIGGWYIPEMICDELVDYFKNSEEKGEGRVHHENEPKVIKEYKTCTQLSLTPDKFILQKYLLHLQMTLDLYKKKFPMSDDVVKYNIMEKINIQHYGPGEGFHAWHFENNGAYPLNNRHLVFMTYLNTLEKSGTEWMYQKIELPCQKGLTVIWPAAWTHTHRGIINKEHDKYIITGWYSFHD